MGSGAGGGAGGGVGWTGGGVKYSDIKDWAGAKQDLWFNHTVLINSLLIHSWPEPKKYLRALKILEKNKNLTVVVLIKL